MRRKAFVLLFRSYFAVFKSGKRLKYQLAAQSRESVEQLCGGFVFADLRLRGEQYIARIETLAHIHRRNARHLLAVENGGLDR